MPKDGQPAASEGAVVLDQRYENWLSKIERQVADIAGLDGHLRSAMCSRTAGPRMVWQPSLGKPGSCGLKASSVTVAWKTLSCLLIDGLAGFGDGLCVPAQEARIAKHMEHPTP